MNVVVRPSESAYVEDLCTISCVLEVLLGGALVVSVHHYFDYS